MNVESDSEGENKDKIEQTNGNSDDKLHTSQTLRDELQEFEEEDFDDYKSRLVHIHHNDPMYLSGPYREDSNILADLPQVLKVIVSGVSDNVGRSVAIEIAKNAHKVAMFLTGKDEEKVKGVAAMVAQLGCRVDYDVGEFSGEKEFEQTFDLAYNFLGEVVDLVVLNGSTTKVGTRLEDTKLGDFEEMMNTNVKEYFYWLRKVVPVMRKRNSGQIIVVTSTLAFEPLGRCAAYCASKHAIQGMIGALREELDGTNVKICTIHTDTEASFIKLKSLSRSFSNGLARSVDPDDVARAAKMIAEQGVASNIEQVVLKSSVKK